jgi:hypothetical protein
MAGNVSLNTVTDGLVMYLDAANTKSLANVPSRNLLLWSQQFDNAVWPSFTGGNLRIPNTTTAPDGTLSAYTITSSGGGNDFIYQSPSISTGLTYTLSYYIKNIDSPKSVFWTVNAQQLVVNWSGNVISSIYSTLGTQSFQSVGNDWYIINHTILSTSTSVITRVYPDGNDTSKSIYLWGAQLELGSVATTYIPTTTVPVSRTPTWVDLSKGGNNGTLTGGLTYNYSNGGSLVFDGVNDYANIPSSPELEITSDLTINIWIYNTLPKSGIGIITKGPLSGDYDYMLYLTSNSTNLNFYKKNSSGVDASGGGFVTTILNTWVNVCFTKEGTTVKGYENGVLRKTDIFTDSNIRTSSNSLKIGNGWTPAFGGKIPQTQIYNRALTAQEVLQNFNAAKSRYGL